MKKRVVRKKNVEIWSFEVRERIEVEREEEVLMREMDKVDI